MRHGWRRETRRLARAASLLAHLTGVILTAYVVFPLFTATGMDRYGYRREAIVRAWMRMLLRILNVRLRVRGSIRRGAVLYCANHISWLDVPCLRAVVDATFVAKSEVRRWPLVGGLAARVDTFFLIRGNHDATSHVADHMTWSLAAGNPVIVFPEGTSTDGRSVRRFHARLYQAATRVHGYVQAIAVRYPLGTGLNPAVPFVGEDNLASHLWRLLDEDKIDAELHFCPALPADGRERRALADTTRWQILGILQPCANHAVSACHP